MTRIRAVAALLGAVAAGSCIFPSERSSAALINVTSYGAVPDDGLDDTSAIRNALLAAQTGDTVLVPAGQWHVSGSLQPKSGTTLAGAGRDLTSLNYLGSSSSVFINISSRSNLTVRDLTLNGQNNAAVEDGIRGSNGSGHQFYDLRIENLVDSGELGPHGIYFTSNVRNSVIHDNEFTNMGIDSEWGAGIRLSNGSNGNQVLQNTIQNTGRGGILTNAATGLTIQRNVVMGSGMSPDGEGLGIEVWGGSHNTLIEDNVIDHWLSVDGSTGVAVRRNVVSDASGVVKDYGLECAECSDVIFTSNTVDRGAFIGLSVSNDDVKEHVYWAHNTISGTENWGAQIQGDADGAREMYFYDNTFELTDADPPNLYSGDNGHGFRINGNTRYLTFDSNRFIDNDHLGFQIGGANVDQLSFVNNTFANNGAQAIRSNYGSSSAYPGSDLEWSGNVLTGNGGNGANTPFVAKGFTTDQNPEIMLHAPSQAIVGLPYNFSFDFVDDGTLGHVLWDFDHGLPVTLTSPSHVFPSPGDYQIGLVVWDNTGRAAHATMLLSVVIPGDYNGDGYVDENDFVEWRNNFGSDSELAADGNGNGIVDAADYTFWRDHWGEGVPPESAHFAPVPEPCGLVLWVLGCCFLFNTRSFRRHK